MEILRLSRAGGSMPCCLRFQRALAHHALGLSNMMYTNKDAATMKAEDLKDSSTERRPDYSAGTNLAGDEIKLISYSILFTKRDAEAILQPEREEIVDYANCGASLASIKVAEFFEHLQRDGIPWPPAWKEPSDQYPEVGQRIRRIPEADLKYVDFICEVRERRAKAEPASDKEQFEVLRKIKDTRK